MGGRTQLGRRARDLGVLVLFATAIGALAALWLSGIAARQLARPIGSLRHAALALAGYPRVDRFHVRDVREEIEHRLWHLLAEYEVSSDELWAPRR